MVMPPAGGPRLLDDQTDQRWPSWSADGRWIYYTSAQTGRDEIWKALAEGGGRAVQVTTNGGDEALESHGWRRAIFQARRREGRNAVQDAGAGRDGNAGPSDCGPERLALGR